MNEAGTAVAFGCPACGAQLLRAAAPLAAPWRCLAGHQYADTRTLIQALRAVGWRPQLELRRA